MEIALVIESVMGRGIHVGLNKKLKTKDFFFRSRKQLKL